MPTTLIAQNTAVVASPPFKVNAIDCPRGFSADVLAGAETVTLSRDNGGGVFIALTDASSILTATLTSSSVLASGTYKLTKTLTASPCGVYLD